MDELISYKCSAPHCINQIEKGFLCDKCGRGFLEDVLCMEQSPSFLFVIYDLFVTKIDILMMKLEYILDKKKVRKMGRKRKKCPNCGDKSIKLKQFFVSGNQIKIRCLNCGIEY